MASDHLTPAKVCRLCLSSNETLIDIFDDSHTTSDVPLVERIHICLPVKVSSGEKLSTKICKTCLDLVNGFHAFWVATKSTQLKLDSLEYLTGDNSTSRTDQILEVPPACSSIALEAGSFDVQLPPSLEINCKNSSTRHSSENQNTKESVCIDCGVHKSDANFKLSHSSRTPCALCSQVDVPKTTEQKKREYECSICEYKNASLSNFKIHMMKHNGKYLATCQYCGRGFYSRSACEEHQSTKHNSGISTNHCSKCNSSYHSKAYFRQHMKTHSSDYKQDHFQCEICGKTYSSWKGIKRHKMIHHQGQVYQCEICDKEVKSLESLNNHKKIHRGEKSFVCATCGKFFRTRNGLSVHERTHSGSKPFKCSICDQTFSQSSTLKVHVRYHNGERPYQCKDCDKKYVTATLLKKHRKSHEEVGRQMNDSNELNLLEMYK